MNEQLDNLEAILLADTPLIDTRAPVEFARGSLPTAVNLPLMSDDERAAVGHCYKHQGQEAAVQLGHQLVSGPVREQRIDAWKRFAQQHPQGALFCFRGGMRSQISQQWLHEAGVEYPRIRGGYKAMRRWLIDELEQLCQSRRMVVVGGKTGCAKTRLINEGNDGQPFPGTVDLEGLANHRGSSFGRRPGGQPAQISFEMALAIDFLRADRRHAGAIIIEDESRLVGRCSLPQPLHEAKQRAPLVLVETDLATRVDHSFENYILANLTELRLRLGDEETAFDSFAEGLLEALDRVRKRLGGDRHQALRQCMEQAIAEHRAGRPEAHKAWIEPMLRDYYDPMYNYQLKHRLDRVIFRGSPREVAEFLQTC